jgi:hypothetical protein
MSNMMLFAVWNRPEMLQIVMEHLIEAYNYHALPNLEFVFAVEYPNDAKVLELVKNFELPTKKIIVRNERYALSKNILEGMKVAMNFSDDYVLFQADDIVVHKTFFKFYDTLINQIDIDRVSTCTTAIYKEAGDLNLVYKGHFYDAAGAFITKHFHENYIKPCSVPHFYENKPKFVTALDARYQEHWKPNKSGDYKYKYGMAEHHQQAGLINRLVDVAYIQEGWHTLKVDVSRVRNIGFYGRNRPGGQLRGNTYEERLEFLRSVVNDKDAIYKLTGTKQYADYVNFDPRLDEWNGKIIFKED